MVININGNSNSNHIPGSKIRPPSSLGASIKITPANSPALKPAARPPHKPSHYSTLSLQTVIGTTTLNPNGFSFHEPTKSFALCAGSATILAEVDQDMNISQRFFRARPTAAPVNPVQSFYNTSTPPTTPDTRIRSLQPAGRSSGINGAPYAGSPNVEWGDNSGSRTWTSRERIKAITCVSISPNGRFLAVGEACYTSHHLQWRKTIKVPLTQRRLVIAPGF